MNSRGVRAFALGIFFTASVIGSYYFNINKVETVPSAKKQLEDKGYIVLSPNEYKMLKNTGNQKNRQTASAQKIVPHKKAPATTSQSSSKPSAANKKVYTFQLEVKAGMNTEEIVHLLAVQKIIANEHEFGQFLIDHNYQSKLQLGTFELTSDMSYDQMAKIITKQSK